MILLETQAQFEQLWFHTKPSEPLNGMRKEDCGWIVYFTATWCGGCKRLDLEKIENTANEKGIPLWKCEDTINNYTGGYCGVRKIPTFLFMKPKQIQSSLTSCDTHTVTEWIHNLP